MEINLLMPLLWLGFAFTAAYIAHDKGYDFGSWLLYGLLIGVFALIIILAKRPATDKEREAMQEGKVTLRSMWRTLARR